MEEYSLDRSLDEEHPESKQIDKIRIRHKKIFTLPVHPENREDGAKVKIPFIEKLKC